MGGLLSALATVPVSVFGSASALTRELSDADAVLRMPLPLSRRIGFVSARGGSGASSTAAYVSNLLAARRRGGMVLAVNASRGPATALWHAGLSGTAQQLPSERRTHARNASDARDGLPATGSGLYTLDLNQLADVAGQPSARLWFDSLTPITRFFDVVSTDWGWRSWQYDLSQVAAASHVVCLVARADRHAADEALSLVPALLEHEDQPRVVVALVDVGGTADRSADLSSDRAPVPVVHIPYDRARASARPISSSALRASTRIAYTRLATTIMRESHVSVDRTSAREATA